MTKRELNTLEYGDIIVGPNRQIARFIKHCQFVRGNYKYIDIRVYPHNSIEGHYFDHFLVPEWYKPNKEEIATIKLLFALDEEE